MTTCGRSLRGGERRSRSAGGEPISARPRGTRFTSRYRIGSRAPRASHASSKSFAPVFDLQDLIAVSAGEPGAFAIPLALLDDGEIEHARGQAGGVLLRDRQTRSVRPPYEKLRESHVVTTSKQSPLRCQESRLSGSTASKPERPHPSIQRPTMRASAFRFVFVPVSSSNSPQFLSTIGLPADRNTRSGCRESHHRRAPGCA